METDEEELSAGHFLMEFNATVMNYCLQGWPEPYIYICICIYIYIYVYMYIYGVYGIFGREITKITVIYGVYIRFWPTLIIYSAVTSLNGFWVALAVTNLNLFWEALSVTKA